jgi:NTE family protein
VQPPKSRVGIAFSGGAARGIAHLGVLKALQEMHVPVQVISGTSSGAIVGTFYSAGYPPEDILKLLKETNINRLMRPAFSRFGLMTMDEVEKVLLKHLGDLSFSDLNNELVITAADINQGITVYFSEGKIIKPLVAACSVPLLYKPIPHGDHLLLDGGLLNNLPVECLTDRCDFVIGSHCNPLDHNARITTMRSMIQRTFQLAINNNVQNRYKYCDLLIEPPGLKTIDLLNYTRADEIFEIGYQYTLTLSGKLKHLAV